MNPRTYPIPAPLLQTIINYLQMRPWQEVNQMLAEIHRIATMVDTPGPLPPNEVPKANGKGDEAIN